jgi:hypothetical protein
MAKHALDPPEVPSAPRIVDYDRKSAKIEWWAPPENPSVHHYIVEMQVQDCSLYIITYTQKQQRYGVRV